MNGESEKSKRLLEEIERVLSGKEIKPEEIKDVSLRADVEFAQKLASLKQEPAPEFAASLKARLLRQAVVQQETARARTSPGWFWRSFKQPVWQAVSAMALLLVIGSILWRAGVFSVAPAEKMTSTGRFETEQAPGILASAPPSPPLAAPATSAEKSAGADNAFRTYFSIEAATDKATYQPGETVSIGITLKNITANTIVLGAFPLPLNLKQADTNLVVYTFSGGQSEKTLAPDETVVYSIEWQQQSLGGGLVASGRYLLEPGEVDFQGQKLKLEFLQPVSFEISPAQGTGGGGATKILEFSLPQTNSAITATFSRLEYTVGGFRVFVSATLSPGYIPWKDYRATADYYTDGGRIKNAGMSTAEYNAGSMALIWFVPEVIPQDAIGLGFVIRKIGDITGSWEFSVPLK